MKKVNLPCDVNILRYYRTYVNVSEDATDAEIREAVVKQIVEEQDLVLCLYADLDIEESDISMVCPDWEGAEPIDEDEEEAEPKAEQVPETRFVINGLEDLIADRKSFVQELGDIFSRDIEILERAVTLIQQSDKPNQKLRSSHGDSRRIVRCNRCGEWLGWEDELVIKDDVEQCPHCGASDALMDVDSGCNFSETEIRELWSMFGDIPMNPETECMEEPFLDFKSGTSREDIWHWFDHQYPGGVHALMYGSR